MYDYENANKSNKLQKVTDSSLTLGFNDGNKTGNDYTYDVNGNLTKDLNKGITKISYNFLNLPTEVLWGNGDKINYEYDASGTKLAKYVQKNLLSSPDATYYINGFQYSQAAGKGSQPVLQFFPTTEGYVNVTDGTTFNYVYNYTDHLGNVRLSYQKEANGSLKVLEENNYYPFGLKHSGYNDTNLANANYKYKYQGQELQDELGLGWYSYKFRNYDPAIGRFFNVDPLSEKYEWQSVYSFSSNQPIHAPELEGLESAKDLLLKTQNVLNNIKKEVKNWVNENKPILYVEAKASGEGNVGIDSKIKGPIEIGVKANYKGQEMGSVKIGAEYDVSKVDVKNTSEVDYKGKNNKVKETSGFGLALGIGYDSQTDKKIDLKTGKVSEETNTKKVSFFGYNYTTTEKNENGKKTSETSHSYQPSIGAGFFLNIQFGLDIGVKFKGK